MVKVNEARRGESYADKSAVMLIKGKAEKTSLTDSPLQVALEYGSNSEGYWNYDRMVLQMEDCTDCLRTLHPSFDIVFLFDHSCGHDRQREDGLNVRKMNKGFGKNQPKMHSTEIKDKTYLGTFQMEPHYTLEVGSIESLVFKETDEGSYWLTQVERDQKRIDVITGSKQVTKIKGELADEMQEKGIKPVGKNTCCRQCRRQAVFQRCDGS